MSLPIDEAHGRTAPRRMPGSSPNYDFRRRPHAPAQVERWAAPESAPRKIDDIPASFRKPTKPPGRR